MLFDVVAERPLLRTRLGARSCGRRRHSHSARWQRDTRAGGLTHRIADIVHAHRRLGIQPRQQLKSARAAQIDRLLIDIGARALDAAGACRTGVRTFSHLGKEQVVAGRVVRTDRGARGQPRKGSELRSDAVDEAIDALRGGLRQHIAHHERAIAPQRVALRIEQVAAPRTTQCRDHQPVRIVLVLRQTQFAVHIARRHLHEQIGRQSGRQIGAQAVAAKRIGPNLRGGQGPHAAPCEQAGYFDIRHFVDAGLVFGLTGDKELHLIAAARGLEAVLLTGALVDWGQRGAVQHVAVRQRIDGARFRRNGRQQADRRDGWRGRGLAPERPHIRIGDRIGDRAVLGRHAVVRFAGLAALGRDHDHAVGRLGAIQGGRRRTFHHLDRFDLGGVNVVQSRRAGPTDAQRIVGVGRGANPINHDDGIVAEGKRVLSANANARASACCPRLHDLYARSAARQQGTHVRHRQVSELVRYGDLRGGIGQFDFALVAADRGNHRRQRERRLGDLKIRHHGHVCQDGHRRLFGFVADPIEVDDVRAGGETTQRIATVIARQRAVRGSRHENANLTDRRSGCRIRDTTGHGTTALSAHGGPSQHGERRHGTKRATRGRRSAP